MRIAAAGLLLGGLVLVGSGCEPPADSPQGERPELHEPAPRDDMAPPPEESPNGYQPPAEDANDGFGPPPGDPQDSAAPPEFTPPPEPTPEQGSDDDL